MTLPTSGGRGTVLVDTDVVSFWQKSDSRGQAYSDILRDRVLAISFQTVAELLRWAVQNNWGERRRTELEDYLRVFVVQPYSINIAREWAEIMVATRRLGRELSVGDGWIAASAKATGLPLATNNRRHFEVVAGLEMITFAP